MVKEHLKEALDAAFCPESIAIIGASNDQNKLGGADLKMLVHGGYGGKIYPINPKETEVQGYKSYKSILDVPDKIDRAVIILPTKFVPSVIKECAQKGVKVVQIYSAGFGEFGDEGKKKEVEMLDIAQRQKMRIIGPNCIGTYCPKGGITFTNGGSMIPGKVAFISQSGGITFDMVNRGKVLGVNYSKVLSVGNCIDLEHCDYLEYLGQDKETKFIGLYIESVKDGQRFLKVLKETTQKKPVVILKGGRTESGSQSVASHTGNLAGNYRIWEALFQQTGAIPVKSIDEMLTVLCCLQDLKTIDSGKLAMIGNGGGATVLATDYLDEVNLPLAKGSSKTVEQLKELKISTNGRNVNPIDLPAHQLAVQNGQLFGDIIRVFSKDEEVKYILFHLNLIPFSSYFDLGELLNQFISQLALIDFSSVNVIGVLRSNEDPEIEKIRYVAQQKLQKLGIPVFRTVDQAAFGISAFSKAMCLEG